MPALRDVYEIADAIKRRSKPDAIVLFGSVAKDGKGQDIDLLVVSDKKDKKKITQSLYCFYKKYSIDTFIVSRKKMRELYFKGSPFLRLIQREGKVIYMKDSLKEWKEAAYEDLRQAEYLYEGEFYRGACYSCQQSSERILKWILLKKGWELEKTHNIRRLVAIADDFGVKLTLNDEEIDFIDSVYRGRYPGEEGLLPIGMPTKKDAKKALQIAEKLVKQVKQIG